MEPEEAVRAAIDRLVGEESDDDPEPDPPSRPAPPQSAGAMLAYWDDEAGGTAGLAAAMAGRRVKRHGSREDQALFRRIERWKDGTRTPDRKTTRRLQKLTRDSWKQTHADELRAYNRDRRRWREKLLPEWRRRNTERRDRILIRLAGDKAIIEFSGLVQISKDIGHRRNVSIVPPGGAMIRFVASAIAGRWSDAAQDLADAWNSAYGIPGRPSWVDVDELIIEGPVD